MENDRKFKLKRCRGWIHKSQHPYKDMQVQKVKRHFYLTFQLGFGFFFCLKIQEK